MATGWINELQGELGRALEAINRAGGWLATYTLVTSHAADTLVRSALTVYMKPVQRGKKFDVLGGRKRENLATAEVFDISREALKIGDTYYEPTLNDSFVKYGTTSPVYYVAEIHNLGLEASGWELTCTTQYRAEATE